MKTKSIKVGIWSYDHVLHFPEYNSTLIKMLYNIAGEDEEVIPVFALDSDNHELFCIATLLGYRYDIWLPSAPRECTRKLDDAEYTTFNRILLGARDFRIVPALQESAAILDSLDILILLMKGQIFVADISGKKVKKNDER